MAIRSAAPEPIHWNLRVSAVRFLNTWPLIWGFQSGPQQGLYDFRSDLPARCAAALRSGEADIGIVPVAEIDRIGLDFMPDLGISCEGPVRSIFLFSKKPFREIRRMAVDSSSRTSVALSRIILREVYECDPECISHRPALEEMLAKADAALIIGDPALRLNPSELPYLCLDLGAEWVKWTGLPMVFAVWAGRKAVLTPDVIASFHASWEWGRDHLDEIVAAAEAELGFDRQISRRYLTENIVFELSERHLDGLELFRSHVRELDATAAPVVAA